MADSQRRILLVGDDGASVAVEAPFETEESLHEAIAAHPEVLPADDLGLGVLVTLASHLQLSEGELDLLCADRAGRLAIVEFKKGSENPDARRVVAQLLDYGAGLWRVTYEELEDRCRAAQPGFSGTLDDHAADRLSRLDEEPLDVVAFRQGVETVLDTGAFTFVYVARDLDPRTRRIGTYLAEGPRLAFFAVEVDHYQGGFGTRVLAPRANFTPSWLAAPGGSAVSGVRGQSPGRSRRAEQLAAAPAAFHDLVGHMHDMARELSLETTQAETGYTFRPLGAAAQALGVYCTSRGAEFNLDYLRNTGRQEHADEMQRRLESLVGRPLGSKWPSVPCEALTANWSNARRELIEPLLEAYRGTISHQS